MCSALYWEMITRKLPTLLSYVTSRSSSCVFSEIFSRFSTSEYNKPKTADELHRSGGIASMMRLPVQQTAQGKQICINLKKSRVLT